MKRTNALKTILFVTALVPAALLVAGLFNDGLGANPIEYITHQTGWFALAFLMASLTVSTVVSSVAGAARMGMRVSPSCKAPSGFDVI